MEWVGLGVYVVIVIVAVRMLQRLSDRRRADAHRRRQVAS